MLVVPYDLQEVERFVQGPSESVHQRQVLAPWHHPDPQHDLLDVQYRGLGAVGRWDGVVDESFRGIARHGQVDERVAATTGRTLSTP